MDESFIPIFEERYKKLTRLYPHQRYVGSLITKAERGEEVHLRSDARLFLLINLVEMYLRPTQWRRRRRLGVFRVIGPILKSEEDDVLNDLYILFRYIRSEKMGSREKDFISANDVLTALAQLGDKAFILGKRVWGPKTVEEKEGA